MACSPDAYTAISPHNPQQTRIALFTDTHYWPGGGEFHGGDGNLQLLGESDTILATLEAEIQAAEPDVVVHLGDFTCGGGTYAMSQDEFIQAVDRVSDVLQRLPAAVFGLPGNHDCPPGGGDWSHFERRWSLKRGIGATVDTPQARLILVNAQGHSDAQIEAAKPYDPVTGWISREELERIDCALAEASDRPVIVLQHQLVRPWIGPREWAHYYGTQNDEDLLGVLGRYGNVRAVFQGHAHRLDVQQAPLGLNNAHFIVTPSLIEYPIAWLDLTLTQTTLSVTLCPLPLPGLKSRSCNSGAGQKWRGGRPEWHRLTIDL